jgi:cytochrome c-type biogenesis protein CcmH
MSGRRRPAAMRASMRSSKRPAIAALAAVAALLGAGDARADAAPSTPSSAGSAAAAPADPALEARLLALARELRCLVCQNESLADSQAGLAEDLRREIRTMMAAGRTDAEIVDFLVGRYGDFVRYRPPVAPRTWLLWGGPGAGLLLGLGALGLAIRRRSAGGAGPAGDDGSRAGAVAPLDADEQARAAALLAEDER